MNAKQKPNVNVALVDRQKQWLPLHGVTCCQPKILVAMYKDMLLIRRFEEKAGQLYGMGQIGGFCHLYIGQEAVVIGLQSASNQGDTVVTSYRDHGHMLACGMDDGVMAELTGREVVIRAAKVGRCICSAAKKTFWWSWHRWRAGAHWRWPCVFPQI